nr:unnamed protein product [Callosobruchus chinensis]
MGCSPSALLEHIHRDSSIGRSEKIADKKASSGSTNIVAQHFTKDSKRDKKSSMPFLPFKAGNMQLNSDDFNNKS